MSDGGDDSIPVMEDIPTHSEAGEAGEEEGVSNIANVNFKLAIKSEMKLSDSHIEAIKTVTAKGNVRNRASIFLQKVDAQKSPRNMNSPMQSGNDHIDSIKKNTEAGNVRNRANMFLKKVDAHQSSPSVPSSSSGKHNSPSNQRKYLVYLVYLVYLAFFLCYIAILLYYYITILVYIYIDLNRLL